MAKADDEYIRRIAGEHYKNLLELEREIARNIGTGLLEVGVMNGSFLDGNNTAFVSAILEDDYWADIVKHEQVAIVQGDLNKIAERYSRDGLKVKLVPISRWMYNNVGKTIELVWPT